MTVAPQVMPVSSFSLNTEAIALVTNRLSALIAAPIDPETFERMDSKAATKLKLACAQISMSNSGSVQVPEQGTPVGLESGSNEGKVPIVAAESTLPTATKQEADDVEPRNDQLLPDKSALAPSSNPADVKVDVCDAIPTIDTLDSGVVERKKGASPDIYFRDEQSIDMRQDVNSSPKLRQDVKVESIVRPPQQREADGKTLLSNLAAPRCNEIDSMSMCAESNTAATTVPAPVALTTSAASAAYVASVAPAATSSTASIAYVAISNCESLEPSTNSYEGRSSCCTPELDSQPFKGEDNIVSHSGSVASATTLIDDWCEEMETSMSSPNLRKGTDEALVGRLENFVHPSNMKDESRYDGIKDSTMSMQIEEKEDRGELMRAPFDNAPVSEEPKLPSTSQYERENPALYERKNPALSSLTESWSNDACSNNIGDRVGDYGANITSSGDGSGDVGDGGGGHGGESENSNGGAGGAGGPPTIDDCSGGSDLRSSCSSSSRGTTVTGRVHGGNSSNEVVGDRTDGGVCATSSVSDGADLQADKSHDKCDYVNHVSVAKPLARGTRVRKAPESLSDWIDPVQARRQRMALESKEVKSEPPKSADEVVPPAIKAQRGRGRPPMKKAIVPSEVVSLEALVAPAVPDTAEDGEETEAKTVTSDESLSRLMRNSLISNVSGRGKAARCARKLICRAAIPLRCAVAGAISMGLYYSQYRERENLGERWTHKNKSWKLRGSLMHWGSKVGMTKSDLETFVDDILEFLLACWQEAGGKGHS
jgi:hypothetical protein